MGAEVRFAVPNSISEFIFHPLVSYYFGTIVWIAMVGARLRALRLTFTSPKWMISRRKLYIKHEQSQGELAFSKP